MSNQGRGEETRGLILDAAIGAFAQYGYDGTGVAEICKSAGISKGAFYHHFESKQALYFELLDNWLRSIDDEFAQILERSETTVEALIEMSKVYQTLFSSSAIRIPVFIEFLARAAREPELQESVLAPYQRYRTYFAELIRRGVAEGSMKSADPDETARLLVAMAVGLLLNGLIDPAAGNEGTIAADAASFFIRELLAAN